MERPEPISVSELNKHIKEIIDNDEYLSMIYVRGEISNFKNHYSGHLYFTLKDQNSLIKCVMFKTYTSYLNFEPKDGQSVVVLGAVSAYERDGIYQIYVKGMEQDGIGALYAEYEKLKERLEKEGLFDEAHKKKIPMLPKSIGVITSKTGAVIKDIINVTTRRFPNVNIKLYPASVQGKGAELTIAQGIKYFNEEKNVDIIIVARGGGSLEDLWPFNEEVTAKAIYNSNIPIISAVGHETDFTISDFVADLRAPTPSAAGELAVPDMKELLLKLNDYKNKLRILLNKKLELCKNQIKNIENRKIFKNSYDLLNHRILNLNNYERQLNNNILMKFKNYKIELVKFISKLDALSPLKTLTRGYAIIESEDGAVIESIKNINKDDIINIQLQDGRKKASVL